MNGCPGSRMTAFASRLVAVSVASFFPTMTTCASPMGVPGGGAVGRS